MSSAARRFERTIACEQGMCLTAPVEVPEDTAKNGMAPGQVASTRRGKPACQ